MTRKNTSAQTKAEVPLLIYLLAQRGEKITVRAARAGLGSRWRLKPSRAAMVFLLVWLLVAAPLPWPVTPVMGAAFTVNTTADTTDANLGDGTCADSSGNCSLRAAIQQANASAGADTIVLQSGATYTLSLDSPGGGENAAADDDLDITAGSTITIQGNGATIQRSTTVCNLNGTDDAGEFRIFEVLSGGTLTLQNVTVKQGCADGGSPDNLGGGILVASGGTLNVTSSTISNNQADVNGAGIYNDGTLTITNSTISGNQADTNGGGIVNSSLGTVTITNSTISNNQAGVNGAGIYNDGTLTITNSTISGNQANTNGGGIVNSSSGTVTITNSTISNNQAGVNGAGVYNDGTVDASFVTIADNSAGTAGQGGGIFNSGGTVNIRNSIVGNNTAGQSGANCAGGVTASGTNLATDASCGTTNFSNVPSTGAGGLNLGPLQVNPPGTTATRALLAGSAAIDAVPAGQCTDVNNAAVTKDQRGIGRPKKGQCDVGAYESELYTLQGIGSCLALDLASKAYVAATPMGTFAGSLEFTYTSTGAIRFRSPRGASPALSGTINVGRNAGSAVLAFGLQRWITILDRNIQDDGPCPP